VTPTLEPFATLAAWPGILVVLAAWGYGEAILLPVVPDVLIGILALAAPELVWILVTAAAGGGVLGALTAWRLLLRRPQVMARILMAQPGLGQPGLDEAAERLRRRGAVGAFSQIGPGLPLKALLHALAAATPDRPAREVAGLSFVNRLVRLGPVALVFAALHPVAAASGWSPLVLASVYVAAWAVFYAAYWTWRDPARR
jgi:membrane protein YqaA with SNARE-associated domain